jgi:signal transduction histidine kinase
MDPGQASPEYAAYIQAIRDETEALGRVVTNFLNFARPVQLTLAPVEVGELVAGVVEEARPDLQARGGTLTAHGAFATVDGDEVLLRQALSNLLRNAVEACAPASIVPHIEIEGRVDAAQDALRIIVSDNGPGIDAAMRERIFRPFFTTRSQGTGLGLALVQKIIVTHNGRITVGSSGSGGAAFHIVLPLSGRR